MTSTRETADRLASALAVNKLKPGACVIHDGVPVELLYSEIVSEEEEAGVCKLLFVSPRNVLRTFRRGVSYRAIHGTLALSL